MFRKPWGGRARVPKRRRCGRLWQIVLQNPKMTRRQNFGARPPKWVFGDPMPCNELTKATEIDSAGHRNVPFPNRIHRHIGALVAFCAWLPRLPPSIPALRKGSFDCFIGSSRRNSVTRSTIPITIFAAPMESARPSWESDRSTEWPLTGLPPLRVPCTIAPYSAPFQQPATSSAWNLHPAIAAAQHATQI